MVTSRIRLSVLFADPLFKEAGDYAALRADYIRTGRNPDVRHLGDGPTAGIFAKIDELARAGDADALERVAAWVSSVA
jgi:hypothetical protein